ncbi:protein NATD1 isoform X2 [Sarcophilus harrisii]|uniref:protein NATD1 isoform X2 n=1 Tax=Sarcophilus harrisii TaxID=9305 RepID=UPI000C798CC5|nr:protein NATD1 isoform X2 [Sarcophilus harrisii]
MAHSAQLNILEQNCPIQVEHDRKRRQFTVKLNGCHDRAVLLYEYVGKRIVDLQHTEVPDAYRGRGIAKHLAKGKRFKGLEILPENFQSYNSLGTEQTEQPKEGLDTTHTSFSPVTPAFLFS